VRQRVPRGTALIGASRRVSTGPLPTPEAKEAARNGRRGDDGELPEMLREGAATEERIAPVPAAWTACQASRPAEGQAVTDLLFFRRTARGIELADAPSAEIVRPIPIGAEFACEIRTPAQARSIRQNNLFHALLDAVNEATGRFRTKELFFIAIKIALGYIEEAERFDGTSILVPKSTRFDKMGPKEFREFFDAAIRLIAEEVMPEIKDLEEARRIYEMMDGS
jgi:hypothetical protein